MLKCYVTGVKQKMISKYTFGKPFNTEAVVSVPETAKVFNNSTEIPFGTLNLKKDSLTYEISLLPEDKVFGLGENLGGINKRGRRYTSWCTDDPNHTEEKQSLYGAHNFLIVYSPEKNQLFGLFLDYPGKIEYDISFSNCDKMSIYVPSTNMDIYLIQTDKPNKLGFTEIIKEFRTMIGKSYVPPLWSMGYMQSRWGYGTADDLDRVYENHKKHQIPLDAIFLDIDYMDEFRDFTINKKNFKDFPATIKKFKDKNIHIVPIIDAGIKVDPDSEIDKEGIEKNFFCKKADGKPIAAGVWPGLSHFTDFLNPEARKWFGSKYMEMVNAGVDGFWNDMNEPAFFYSEDGLKKAYEKIMSLINDQNPNVFKTWDIKNEILNVQNSMEDYRSFYHQVPEEIAGNLAEKTEHGLSTVNHEKVHNLYGYNMSRAAGEYFSQNVKDRQILLISRASYIGMHRYCGIWTGDNSAWWSHLLLCLKQLPSINMCGFLYTGCDLGGFGNNTYRELLLRFLSLGIFTPLMRNHSALGTREQECYQFENPEDFRGIISLRYRLLPYLWNLINDCAENNSLYFKPLCFEYPEDKTAAQTEDQLLIGDELMIAPVYTANATGRSVYLPEPMTCVVCSKGKGLESGTPEMIPLEKGMHFINVPLNQIVFFIRKGKQIPVTAPAPTTAELNMKNLEYWKSL